MIEVEVDIEGNPKGPIKGNCLCWLGNLEYVTKDASDPDKKLLTNYNKRQKRFGEQCVGKDTRVVSAFQNYCELVGIKRARSINNMWAKKSFATTTLGVMQLPAAQVMVTTGHRLEQTVREFYYPSRLSFIPNSLLSTKGKHAKSAPMDTNSHIRGPIQLARFLDGTNPRVPRTVAQMYKEVVDQSGRN